MRDSGSLTRRDFLRGTAYGGVGVAMGLGTGPAAGAGAAKSRVVLIRNENLLDPGHQIRTDSLGDMLDQAVCALSGEDDPPAAWQTYFAPDDTVGLKINTMMLKTPEPLVQALRARVVGAGVAKDSIRATDREARDQLADCTALLNTCGLKSHWMAGIGGAVKNYLPFAPRDTWKDHHANGCSAVGRTHNLPACRGKTRLIVIDAMRPLFHGGPQVNPHYLWDYKGLLVSTDPVAADTVGIRLLQAKRDAVKGESWPLSPPPIHVEAADKEHGLGTSNWESIDLVRMGWEKDALI